MAETSGELTRHIRDTEAQLRAHLDELEHKVHSAIDWHQLYSKKPSPFLVAAISGGLLVALLAGRRRANWRYAPPLRSRSQPAPPRRTGFLQGSLSELKGALIGVAVSHAKDALLHLIRGSNDQPGDAHDHSR